MPFRFKKLDTITMKGKTETSIQVVKIDKKKKPQWMRKDDVSEVLEQVRDKIEKKHKKSVWALEGMTTAGRMVILYNNDDMDIDEYFQKYIRRDTHDHVTFSQLQLTIVE